jgi:hypothetical protein
MKYLCLGYFSPSKMEALTKPQLSAIMAKCRPHMDNFYASGHVMVDAGLDLTTKSLQRINGQVTVTDGPIDPCPSMIGAAFVIDAGDLNEAIRIAALHPTTQVPEGEALGWHIQVRPIHHFQTGQAIAQAQ